MKTINNEDLISLNNIFHHSFSNFGLKISKSKQLTTGTYRTFNCRLLSNICKIYLNSNRHYNYIIESKHLILNSEGTFIVNPKIDNKNLISILENLIININFMECFVFKQLNKEIYPNIFVLLYFDENSVIKSYKVEFISPIKKQVLIFTRNKQVYFSKYNIERLSFNKFFEEESVFSILEKDKYTKILNEIWSDLIPSTNDLDYFNNVKNLNKILMY